jgi:translation initiation factor 5A
MELTETKLNEIKKCMPGSFIVIDDEPSVVTDLKISKPGKHGEAKARLEAVGIFDNQKRILVKPADHKMRVPVILKKSAQVLAISGDHVQLMDMETYETFETSIPEELKDRLQEGKEVLIWKFGAKMLIKSMK